MAATKTVWWDKNQDRHEGWIKDGKTYMDEAATTRVPVGATVQTAGGTYKMTSNGGIPTYETSKNQYEQKSNAAINAYRAAGKVQEERIKSATDAAIAEFNRQKQVAEQNRMDADEAAKEAYLKAANPFGALEEQRVKLGLDESGYAESSKLKLASAYAAQQNENQRAMNEQLRALDVQIAQARASGDYELADMYEARAQNIMQQQIALQNNLFSGDMQAFGQAENTRQFDEQMAAQKEQAEKEKKWNLAMAFIENGKDASFIAETLDIPQDDVNTLIAAVNAQKTVRSSGGGVRYNPQEPKTSYVEQMLALGSDAAVAEWLIRNNFSESEKETLRGLYETEKEERAKAQSSGAYAASVATHNSKLGTAYDSVWKNVRRMLDTGKTKEDVIAYVTRFADNGLTDAGIMQIEKNLGW